MKLALALMLAAGTAAAQEFITADGPLSDTDFYRLVSCAAPPAGACQKPLVRWSPADAQDVSIGIVQVEHGYPEDAVGLISAALQSAINQLNAADANLRVTLSDQATKPDIGIHLLAIASGGVVRNTGLYPLDGIRIDSARAQLWWRADLSLIKGAIVFAKDVDRADVPSIMLEEVTQAMGLLTDIGGTRYQTTSIFSETSNQVTQLGDQDIMALRRHYPITP